VHQTVDRRGGSHRVLEDPIPLAEDNVTGDDHGPPLVAFGEEREEDLHLVAALLHIADVVEDHSVVGIERGELLLEAQIALGGEQSLDEREGRGEEDAVAALNELVADRADEVRLAASRQPEREDVVAALDEGE